MNPDRLPDPAKKTYIKMVAYEFTGNQSGFEPIGTKVLVMTDWVDEMVKGGLIKLVPETIERMSLAVTSGTIAAVGGGAFSDWPNSDRKWPGATPSVGDRVEIAKYAGLLLEGKDGRHYRLVQDTDICAIKSKEM